MDIPGDYEGYSSDGDHYCSAASAFGTPSSSLSLSFSDLPPVLLLPPPPSGGSSADLDASGDSDSSMDGSAQRSFRLVDRGGRPSADRRPLVMGTSVAFGSDDWDDFVNETNDGDANLPPFYLHEDHPAWIVQNEELQEEQNDRKSSLLLKNAASKDNGRFHHVAVNGEISGLEDIPCREQLRECREESFSAVTGSGSIVSFGVPSATEGAGGGVEEVPYEKVVQNGNSTVSRVVEIQRPVLSKSFELDTDCINTEGIDTMPDEVHGLDVNESFAEMVSEMEEILLDGGDPQRAELSLDGCKYLSQQSVLVRDGSATASTSGTDDASPTTQFQSRIEWVEVVGAKQRKGDVSFGERMVGVQEYTVYILRVYSGDEHWEIERRYREFSALHRQLNAFFTANGLSLPSPWHNVDRESRKIFGNASPNVVSERSTLIQNCLRSILTFSYPFEIPKCLVSFLSPGKPEEKSSVLSYLPQPLQKLGNSWNSRDSEQKKDLPEHLSSMGMKISLVVEIKPEKSVRHMLELQHYTCAGCHGHLDIGTTIFSELIKTVGWNGPRFCAYTGQLFCSSCHTNDSFILPARVLHLWDFSLHPVSQSAKAYLESIYNQPMLCVSAVNPFLFSKVPILHHVMGIRKKIASMLPYIRCPYRVSVHRSIGIRRYLLESNDFFALHDLVDISKGPFAALPIMMETLCNRILEHITQQCLVCYDVGVPCAARQACDDPVSLIFPFQESEAAKCTSCGSVFHKRCFAKLDVCSCSKPTRTGTRTAVVERGIAANWDRQQVAELSEQPASTSSGFVSGMLSKARPDKLWKPKNSSPVILMGSLPTAPI